MGKVAHLRWSCKMRRTSGHNELMQSGNRNGLRRGRESNDNTMSDGRMDIMGMGRSGRQRKRKIV